MKRSTELPEDHGVGGTVNDLPSISVRRPVLVLVLNLLIVLGGIAAILAVEIRELPDVDRPIVSVRAEYPGASPETMDAEVISIIEGSVDSSGNPLEECIPLAPSASGKWLFAAA